MMESFPFQIHSPSHQFTLMFTPQITQQSCISINLIQPYPLINNNLYLETYNTNFVLKNNINSDIVKWEQ